MSRTTRLHGHDAIRYAEEHCGQVNKYADPVEDAREGLTVEQARIVACEDPNLIYVDPEPVYEAYRYAADGHAGEVDPADPALSDGAVLATGSLLDCRMAIYRRLEDAGFDPTSLRWPGSDQDVEGYHEDGTEGCGGWAIRPVR
jgi:hypothetical protein